MHYAEGMIELHDIIVNVRACMHAPHIRFDCFTSTSFHIKLHAREASSWQEQT